MYLILNRYHVHICRHHSLRKHVTRYPAGLRTGLSNCITSRDYVIPQTGDLIHVSTSLIRYIVGIPYVLLKSGKKKDMYATPFNPVVGYFSVYGYVLVGLTSTLRCNL